MASLISKIVAEIDYSVKVISKRRTTRILLLVFVENRIFFIFDLGIDIFMTLN